MQCNTSLDISLYSTDIKVNINFDVENCGVGGYECHGYCGFDNQHCVTEWEINHIIDSSGVKVLPSDLSSIVLADLEKLVDKEVNYIDALAFA